MLGIMKIQELYNLYLANRRISIDSRKPVDGDIFFALKGEKFNGNRFAKEALDKGCSYAVVDEKKYVGKNRFILVDDVLTTLQKLAAFHRKKLSIPVIAITGTNGKTTTKELLTRILAKSYLVTSTKENYNNHIGVPLTVLDIDFNTEIAVVEIGANHIGEIAALCEIAQPDYGIITNIAKAHLEGFGSLGNIKKAKSELYNYLENKHGTIFYDENNETISHLLKGRMLSKVSVGNYIPDPCSYNLISANPFLRMKMTNRKKEFFINTKLIGRYNAENVKAAIRIGKFFKVEINNILKEIESYQPENNRSQFYQTSSNTLFLDAYNANPTSMKLAIEDFISLNYKNKLLILGDMFELGNDSLMEHKKILSLLKEKKVTNVFLIGEYFSKANNNPVYKTFQNTEKFLKWVKVNPVSSYYILIKGSRVMQLENVVELL
jgi:UDP-N-acetylmuramoyl-tripeptide--D-alanyl-D-alanine ligase